MPVAVKGASVLLDDVADWDPSVKFFAIGDFAIFVNLHVWVEVDIVHQLGVGVGVCCLTVLAVDEIAEVFKLGGGEDFIWVVFAAIVFVIILEHWAVEGVADDPGIALEVLAEFVEIVDGGCACCAAAVANAGNFWILLQEIAACDAAAGAAAAVQPHNAADIIAGAAIGAADLAGVVAVCNAAAVKPHNAADVVIAADAAGVVAVFHGAAAVKPHNAADRVAAAAIGTADAAGVVAVFDAGAGVVIPHNAADIVIAADVAGVVAVFDGAVVPPHNAADIHSAADCAGDAEVLHFAAAADIAKEALIIGVAVDIEAADGVASAVEGAGVGGGFAVTDWGPGNGLSVYIFSADLTEIDIVHQLSVGAGICRIAVCAIDELGKFF